MSQELAVVNAEVVQSSPYMPVMSIDLALARREAIVQYVSRIMVPDQDFGQIPGTKKPTLLKPGAEKLCCFFGLSPEYTVTQEIEDWTGDNHGGEPLYYVKYRCTLTRDGKIMGQGEGSGNSWESKYRYRWVLESDIPASVIDKSSLATRGGKATEFAFAIDKADTSGQYGKPAEYWQRWRAAIKSGAAVPVKKTTKAGKKLDAWEMDATLYRVPNEDFADIINTVQKMAQKRALIAAVLIAVSASEFFTQDLEDLPSAEPTPPPEYPEDVDTGGAPPNTKQAAQNVADRKIREMKAKPEAQAADDMQRLWQRMGTKIASVCDVFADLRAAVGDETYYATLGRYGMTHSNDVRTVGMTKARQCASELYQAAPEAVRESLLGANQEEVPA